MRWGRKLLSWITVLVMIFSLTYAPVPVGAAAIGIESITISEATAQGFRVTAKLIAEAGVKEVLMPTWTEANGQDDLKWYKASVSGNQATYYVPASDHNGESGKYITHVYLYDNQGKTALKGAETVLMAAAQSMQPTIGNVQITEVSSAGYRVTADISAAGVSKVEMPTWTQANGQDDLVWHQASVLGGQATFYVSAALHNRETGKYITHIYLYDNQGRKALKAIEAELPSAGGNTGNAVFSIESVNVTEVTSAGYRIMAVLNSSNGISEVEMPTWTEANGQDDLIWYKAEISGNTAVCYVKASDHKNESGKYITHVYVRDVLGNEIIKGIETVVPVSGGQTGGSTPSAESSIDDVSLVNLSSNGFRIRAKINAPAGVKEILMPTWTEANGQDDLIWYKTTVNASGYAEVDINVLEHKAERGKYITHIYLRDQAGKEVIRGIEVTVPQPETPSGGNTAGTSGTLEIKNVTITEVTQAGFRVSAAVNAPAGIKEVVMPTWSEAGGQDDLIWHKAEVNGGVATYYVKTSDHWNASGKYITHIYLRDLAGKEVLVGTEAVVPAAQSGNSGGSTGGTSGGTTSGGTTSGGTVAPPVISNVTVSERTTAGYRVTAQISAAAGVSKVEMPTWTTANGQDDLVWHQATVNGTTATCYISSASHNGESGAYATHVYLYDNAGNKAISGVETTVPATPGDLSGGLPTGGNAGKLTVSIPFITELNSTGYTAVVTFSAPLGAQRIAAAVWTVANGQDDLVWYEMTINGDKASVRVPISNHNYERGPNTMYTTIVYLYDSMGNEVHEAAHVPVR